MENTKTIEPVACTKGCITCFTLETCCVTLHHSFVPLGHTIRTNNTPPQGGHQNLIMCHRSVQEFQTSTLDALISSLACKRWLILFDAVSSFRLGLRACKCFCQFRCDLQPFDSWCSLCSFCLCKACRDTFGLTTVPRMQIMNYKIAFTSNKLSWRFTNPNPALNWSQKSFSIRRDNVSACRSIELM